MSDRITSSHLARAACVYLRQSTAAQVERNRESTARQYKLVDRAVQLGWCRDQVRVIDEDLGVSGAGTTRREGFEVMASEVALGRVGLILAIEVSRVARNNAEWYRLLDFCGVSDTLIGDEDGLYHPGLYNDRLLLGLKGTMSEAELHVIRARLLGGIRNKAQRGELRRGLPIGFVWGEADGEVRFDPDEAVTHVVRTVFGKFAETGSARQVWVWFRGQKLQFPSRPHMHAPVRWIPPTYHALHSVLTSPVYAGAYRYGRSRSERYIDKKGQLRKKSRLLPRSEWQVLIKEHHPGFIDWDTYEMNQVRLAKNTRPLPHQSGGAIREGAALLQGLATCGRCGRKLKVYYQGKYSTPGYHCPGSTLANGRAVYCLRIGGVRIDRAVGDAFLEAVEPAGVEAAFEAERMLNTDRDAALAQWRLQVERAQYEAQRAERRYRTVEPENRLVARSLEAEWETRLGELAAAKTELENHQRVHPRLLTDVERAQLQTLDTDLKSVWSAPSTTDRDRKELLQSLLEEVCISVDRGASNAHLMLRWRGGMITERNVTAWTVRVPAIKTDEDTIELLCRLAPHYPDAVIAGILNRQGRRSATGERFTVSLVGNLRRYRKIPRHQPVQQQPEGDAVPIAKAAEILGVAPSTLHRCLVSGIIIGEQLTPGAPWRIRVTEELRARFVEEAPKGFMPIVDAMRLLGVSRQTVLQRVKRGELEAMHVRLGRRKGLRIKVLSDPMPLFETVSLKGV
jgi:DNA invertase Pin-like site-specific DNA recombinase